MARLLYEALSREIAPEYVQKLLAAFPNVEPEKVTVPKSTESASVWIEPLSDRELEVLQLIAEGVIRFAGVYPGLMALMLLPASSERAEVMAVHHVQRDLRDRVIALFEHSVATGALTDGPFAGNSFWTGFGGPCENNNDGDPVVLYDDHANQWFFSQFSIGEGVQCVAVSVTSDPLGPYHRYAFTVTPGGNNDYPKLGVWDDGTTGSTGQSAYTFTLRDFGGAGGGFSVSAGVMERDAMLADGLPSVVRFRVPEGKTTCGLCSRLRRGALYNFAAQNAVTRIALGHHRDDIIETLFLNLFNGGRLKAMPPKLLSDDGRNVVIRPLAYCAEKDIRRYAQNRAFPIIPCNLCGSQPNLQRQAIKAMLGEWKKRHPGRIENIFRALGHVSPSQLADRELFDFAGLGVSGTGVPETSDWTMPERKRIELNVIN